MVNKNLCNNKTYRLCIRKCPFDIYIPVTDLIRVCWYFLISFFTPHHFLGFKISLFSLSDQMKKKTIFNFTKHSHG